MQIKFLKAVVEDVADKQASPIVDLLVGKKNVNEFIIAKKLELTINQTRNILYKLSDHGLVSFIRKKDRRKGWYIYFWTLNVYRSLVLLEQKLHAKLVALEKELRNRREKRHYICRTCSIEVSEEVALLHDFVCPECEEVYEVAESADIITQVEKDIVRIRKDIIAVSVETAKEASKMHKKKQKVIEKAEKERREKRAEARKKAAIKRKATIAAAKKSSKKKSSKKKPSQKKISRHVQKKGVTKKSQKNVVKAASRNALKKSSKKKPPQKKTSKVTSRKKTTTKRIRKK